MTEMTALRYADYDAQQMLDVVQAMPADGPYTDLQRFVFLKAYGFDDTATPDDKQDFLEQYPDESIAVLLGFGG